MEMFPLIGVSPHIRTQQVDVPVISGNLIHEIPGSYLGLVMNPAD